MSSEKQMISNACLSPEYPKLVIEKKTKDYSLSGVINELKLTTFPKKSGIISYEDLSMSESTCFPHELQDLTS